MSSEESNREKRLVRKHNDNPPVDFIILSVIFTLWAFGVILSSMYWFHEYWKRRGEFGFVGRKKALTFVVIISILLWSISRIIAVWFYAYNIFTRADNKNMQWIRFGVTGIHTVYTVTTVTVALVYGTLRVWLVYYECSLGASNSENKWSNFITQSVAYRPMIIRTIDDLDPALDDVEAPEMRRRRSGAAASMSRSHTDRARNRFMLSTVHSVRSLRNLTGKRKDWFFMYKNSYGNEKWMRYRIDRITLILVPCCCILPFFQLGEFNWIAQLFYALFVGLFVGALATIAYKFPKYNDSVKISDELKIGFQIGIVAVFVFTSFVIAEIIREYGGVNEGESQRGEARWDRRFNFYSSVILNTLLLYLMYCMICSQTKWVCLTFHVKNQMPDRQTSLPSNSRSRTPSARSTRKGSLFNNRRTATMQDVVVVSSTEVEIREVSLFRTFCCLQTQCEKSVRDRLDIIGQMVRTHTIADLGIGDDVQSGGTRVSGGPGGVGAIGAGGVVGAGGAGAPGLLDLVSGTKLIESLTVPMILDDEFAFRIFMAHLFSEFSYESLMCIVELTQFADYYDPDVNYGPIYSPSNLSHLPTVSMSLSKKKTNSLPKRSSVGFTSPVPVISTLLFRGKTSSKTAGEMDASIKQAQLKGAAKKRSKQSISFEQGDSINLDERTQMISDKSDLTLDQAGAMSASIDAPAINQNAVSHAHSRTNTVEFVDESEVRSSHRKLQSVDEMPEYDNEDEDSNEESNEMQSVKLVTPKITESPNNTPETDNFTSSKPTSPGLGELLKNERRKPSAMKHKTSTSISELTMSSRVKFAQSVLDTHSSIVWDTEMDKEQKFCVLCQKYIMTEAEMSVNIAFGTRKHLTEICDFLLRGTIPAKLNNLDPSLPGDLQQLRDELEVTPDVFSVAIFELMRLMRDSLARFQLTVGYETLLKNFNDKLRNNQ